MEKLYRLGLYEKSMPGSVTLKEKLRCAREAGFDYLELSVDETDEKLARLDWTKEETESLIRDICDTGCPVHSICLSGHRRFPLGHPEKAVRERSMEIMEKAIRLADRIGVRLIQLAGYDVYYVEGNEMTRLDFLENLRKACETAAAYGVVLAFETMETPFMDTVRKAEEIVREIGSPWLQIYPDLGNLTNASVLYGTSVVDDLETGKGRLSAMHLKETVPGIYREVSFGTGHVDFETGIRKALELGVRMFVGEFWYTGEPHWKEELEFANRFLREKIARAAQMGSLNKNGKGLIL